jgi:hypothetical protein
MGVFLGSATDDVEIRATAIAVPLHPAQGKGVHRGKLLPEYCRGLGAPPNLKNLLVGQERDILKTEQTKNYSTDDHHSAPLFAHDELYQRLKFGLRKIQHGGTAQH